MRELSKREIEKRGCKYCADVIPPGYIGRFTHCKCPHEKCPYHELDKVKTYQEYLKKAKVGGLAKLLANLARGNDR